MFPWILLIVSLICNIYFWILSDQDGHSNDNHEGRRDFRPTVGKSVVGARKPTNLRKSMRARLVEVPDGCVFINPQDVNGNVMVRHNLELREGFVDALDLSSEDVEFLQRSLNEVMDAIKRWETDNAVLVRQNSDQYISVPSYELDPLVKDLALKLRTRIRNDKVELITMLLGRSWNFNEANSEREISVFLDNDGKPYIDRRFIKNGEVVWRISLPLTPGYRHTLSALRHRYSHLLDYEAFYRKSTN